MLAGMKWRAIGRLAAGVTVWVAAAIPALALDNPGSTNNSNILCEWEYYSNWTFPGFQEVLKSCI
jgi:hypothetical protein